jgi:hypothetical protein
MSDTYVSETGGERRNVGKLRFELIPPSWGRALAAVLTKGAAKYADRNWEKGLPLLQTLASAERHIAAYKAGQDVDPETGLSHLAHAATNLLMALETHRRVYDCPLAPLPTPLDNRPIEWDEQPEAPAEITPCAGCHLTQACNYFGGCIVADLALRRSVGRE